MLYEKIQVKKSKKLSGSFSGTPGFKVCGLKPKQEWRHCVLTFPGSTVSGMRTQFSNLQRFQFTEHHKTCLFIFIDKIPMLGNQALRGQILT